MKLTPEIVRLNLYKKFKDLYYDRILNDILHRLEDNPREEKFVCNAEDFYFLYIDKFFHYRHCINKYFLEECLIQDLYTDLHELQLSTRFYRDDLDCLKLEIIISRNCFIQKTSCDMFYILFKEFFIISVLIGILNLLFFNN